MLWSFAIASPMMLPDYAPRIPKSASQMDDVEPADWIRGLTSWRRSVDYAGPVPGWPAGLHPRAFLVRGAGRGLSRRRGTFPHPPPPGLTRGSGRRRRLAERGRFAPCTPSVLTCCSKEPTAPPSPRGAHNTDVDRLRVGIKRPRHTDSAKHSRAMVTHHARWKGGSVIIGRLRMQPR
jgi:hypothetical protein